MRILVTGVTGQDGAYLSSLLLSQKHKVVGVSPNRSSGRAAFWRLNELGITDKIDLRTMDITCPASVTSVIANGGFDEVYNLAAQSFVAESFKSPVAVAQTNYIGVLNILEAIRQHSPNTRFYQASTSEMFGRINVKSQDESTPFHPSSPYACAKAAAHYTVQNYREAYGLYACSGILFNHESPLRGIEFVTRKVTDGVAAIVAGKQKKLSLGNLDVARDWGHAMDYVRGMTYMLRTDEYGPADYVLATGRAHTLRQMVDYAFSRVGLDYTKHVKQDERYMRPSDVPFLCGNAHKARNELAWMPSVTFEAMIGEMVDADLMRHGVDAIEMYAGLANKDEEAEERVATNG